MLLLTDRVFPTSPNRFGSYQRDSRDGGVFKEPYYSVLPGSYSATKFPRTIFLMPPLSADASDVALEESAAANPWYGIRTKSRFEKVAAKVLENKGYIVYLPLIQSRRRWSDRVTEVLFPLFPGYLFCRFDPLQRLPIVTTAGVVSIIGLGKEPEAIPEEEIEAVQAVLGSGLAAGPWPYLRDGERIRIVKGALDGLEGILVRKKSQWRIVVSIDLLQRSVAAEVDSDWVRPA